MAPLFFEDTIPAAGEMMLGEESSRHAVQVLRMQPGSELSVTNGKGYTINGTMLAADKKKATLKIVSFRTDHKKAPEKAIAISLIKNTSRFEWFIEKATEIGISSIFPILCERTEKAFFKYARIRSIAISAMLQSQQSWLPEITNPAKFSALLAESRFDQKMIAHCLPAKRKELPDVLQHSRSGLIIIGPEGDFTPAEIQSASDAGFTAVSLGETRLRTETAGVVAATWMVQAK